MEKIDLEMYNITYKELLQKLEIQGEVYDLIPAEDGIRLITFIKRK